VNLKGETSNKLLVGSALALAGFLRRKVRLGFDTKGGQVRFMELETLR